MAKGKGQIVKPKVKRGNLVRNGTQGRTEFKNGFRIHETQLTVLTKLSRLSLIIKGIRPKHLMK